MFRTCTASSSTLRALRPEGPPERKTFAWDLALSPPREAEDEVRADGGDGQSVGGSSVTFRLKVGSLPELPQGGRRGLLGASATWGSAKSAGRLTTYSTGAADPPPTLLAKSASLPLGAMDARGVDGLEDKPLTRVQRYYNALMKAQRQREEAEIKETYGDEMADAEEAAAKAARTHAKEEARATREDSDSDEETEDDDDVVGPLRPYDGAMKVQLEVLVRRAPGEKVRTECSASIHESSTSETSSVKSESTPRLNLADELQALQEEMQGLDDSSDSDDSSDGLPSGLRTGKAANIWDSRDPRLALGIGGSVFFVPDAERYALMPSLPPPPPASLVGRHRKHLKPRLPLDISNHRYRDEHPNIWPEPEDRANAKHKEAFRQKVLMYDFYAGSNAVLGQLPPLQHPQDEQKHKAKFGQMLDAEITRRSFAWREKVRHQRLKERQEAEEAMVVAREEAQRLAEEQALAQAAARKAAKRAR